jgi:hypothetical protein
MDRIRRYFSKLNDSIESEKFKGDLPDAHFVSGPASLVRIATEQNGPNLAVLPEGLLPGYHLLGRFEPQAERPGNVTLVHAGQRETRSCIVTPGLEVYLYPVERPAYNALWSDELSPEKLGPKLMLACLAQPYIAPGISQFAYRWLLLTDDQQLKAAPIFPMLNGPAPGTRLTLKELSRVRRVELVRVPTKKGPPAKGAVRLRDLASLRQILTRYNIRFRADKKHAPADTKWVKDRYAKPPDYYQPAWAEASRRGDIVVIPIFGQGSLSVDIAKLKLRTPVQNAEGMVEIDFSSGLHVHINSKSVDGDLKTHEIHLLTVSAGKHRVSYRARFKDYYEGGPIQAELDVRQDRARSVLFRLARALEDPRNMKNFEKLF